MFSWKPIYRELAQALMAYRVRQDELIQIIKEMKAQGLSVIPLKDVNADGVECELDAIDPFTFFANFNRGIKEAGRREILAFLKIKFGLRSPVPDDFHALPVVMKLNALFFPFSGDHREEDDISSLWALAADSLILKPSDLDASLFSRCLQIKQVGVAKLTMGLFWFNPDAYLALDGTMLEYLKKQSVIVSPIKINELPDYVRIVNDVRTRVGTDYVKISRDAYLSDSLPISQGVIDEGFKSFLGQLATRNQMSVEQVAKYLKDGTGLKDGGSEIGNRLQVLPEISALLNNAPINLSALRKACMKLWVFKVRSDAMWLNAFLSSHAAQQAISDLLDENTTIDEVERIDRFVNIAVQNGYTSKKGKKDAAGAAQLASVLLSAVMPERFVDYRDSRWNSVFRLITDSKKLLCTGSSYGMKLVLAGKFAAALADTPTFIELFGADHGLWSVAGLVWWLRQGLFTFNIQPSTPKPNSIQQKTQATQGASMNLILYGPPGTGKTYQTIRRAVEIIDGKSSGTDEEIKKRFDQLLDQSQIGFVTFHQSYSYEDFVEGIRPVMDDDGSTGIPRYECRDGIFKTMCATARSDTGVAGAVAESDWGSLRIWKMSLGDTLNPDEAHIYDDCIKGNFIAHGAGRGLDFTKAKTPEQIRKALESIDWTNAPTTLSHNIKQIQALKIDMRKGDIVIISHGNHKFRAIGRVNGEYKFDPSCDYPQTRPVKWLRIFSEPQTKDRLLRGKAFSQLTLYSLAEKDIKMDSLREMLSRQDKKVPGKYVLVIDEINRGNISKILGELITLIEPDKRQGQRHALSVTLPYSKEPFSVPGNLYIIGTMNTADKSIALVDVALRRRFEFEELMPDFTVCAKLTADMRDVLNKLNYRIVLRKDRDHQIGHAYFFAVGTIAEFNHVFAKQIIPLLQEYFYNDWEGLRYVLGETGTSSGTFIKSVGDAERKWARTLWQFSDELGKVSILGQLVKNYNGGVTANDQPGK